MKLRAGVAYVIHDEKGDLYPCYFVRSEQDRDVFSVPFGPGDGGDEIEVSVMRYPFVATPVAVETMSESNSGRWTDDGEHDREG